MFEGLDKGKGVARGIVVLSNSNEKNLEKRSSLRWVHCSFEKCSKVAKLVLWIKNLLRAVDVFEHSVQFVPSFCLWWWGEAPRLSTHIEIFRLTPLLVAKRGWGEEMVAHCGGWNAHMKFTATITQEMRPRFPRFNDRPLSFYTLFVPFSLRLQRNKFPKQSQSLHMQMYMFTGTHTHILCLINLYIDIYEVARGSHKLVPVNFMKCSDLHFHPSMKSHNPLQWHYVAFSVTYIFPGNSYNYFWK